MQGAWSAVLILSGSFELLIDYRIFGIWMLNVATVAGVIALRRKQTRRCGKAVHALLERLRSLLKTPQTPHTRSAHATMSARAGRT